MPNWLQELPLLNVGSPEHGLYVALGTFEGVLNPIFDIDIIYGHERLGFIGPSAGNVWHLNEKWRFEVVHSETLVTNVGSTRLVEEYGIIGPEPASRIAVESLTDSTQLYGKLILDE